LSRSALVLRGLCHGPTGAIAAAGTTSLPECIGGVRNWDYRYCWPRDAALSSSALVRLGSNEEAVRFLDWLLGVVDQLPSPDRLNPIYTVSGNDLPAEAEIRELPGYAASRPVRVGNAANKQVQLDVFGPIVELVYLLLHSGAPLSSEHWRLVEAMVSAVSTRWREADHGIWEIRRPCVTTCTPRSCAGRRRTWAPRSPSGSWGGPAPSGGRSPTRSKTMSSRRAGTRRSGRSPAPTASTTRTRRSCSSG
jgi:GH15 family glucan-1,4-alpha-glucosidase